MVALSVLGDKPPNALQPTLADGIHLRWASSREVGFPWGGYYLFRREHKEESFNLHRACISKDFLTVSSSAPAASFLSAELTNSFVFDGGELSSDINFRLAELPDGEVGLDLTGGHGIWFSAIAGESIWRAQLAFHFRESAEVEIRSYFGKRAIGETRVKGVAGKRSLTSIEFSAITRLHIGAGPASLVQLCVDPVGPGATENWEPVAWAPAPFALPVTNPDYSCAPDAENLWHSRFTARGRIRYRSDPDAIPDPTTIWSLGTLVLEANSSLVLGHGTGWDQNLAGGSLQVTGEPAAYVIAAVLTPEKLVLNRRYRGASNPNASYTISRDNFGQLHDALMLLVNGGPAAGPMGSRLLPESIDEQGTLTLNHQSPFVRGIGVNWKSEYAGLTLYVGRKAEGRVSATQGEVRILGDATGFEDSLVGLDIRIGSDSHTYTVVEVNSESELKLDRPFEGETTGGLPFSLWDKTPYLILHTLSDISRIDVVTQLRLDRPYEGPTGSGIPYAIRCRLQSSEGTDTSAAPILAPQRALDLVNLASLEPNIAEALGLAWNDHTVDPDVFYDYLIVANTLSAPVETVQPAPFFNLLPALFPNVLSAEKILSRIRDRQFSDLDGFIVFNVSLRAPAAPLSPPDDVHVFSLPGATHLDSDKKLLDSSNNAGLRWSVSGPESALTSSSPIFFHVWRADFGEISPELSSEMPEYRLLTPRPLLVSKLGDNSKSTAPSSTDWPPLSLLKVDSSLPDGWYSYQVSGIDIFGRHSKNSFPAEWRQWRPAPQPEPWYFNPAAANDVVHPFAIQLLDKIPPPPPTAIEAFALDPRDPAVVRDAAYQRWAGSFPGEVRDKLVGLRVRWHWTPSQGQQAPDLREFRLYLEPGPMNARMGRISHVTTSGTGWSWVETDIEHSESDQAFVGAWLRVGGQAFLILGSKSASPLTLIVRHIGPDRETAPRVGGCALVIPPLFSLGTVSVEHGSMEVTGVETRWHPALTGMKLKVSNELDLYTISSVADAEHLTLGERYKGAPAVGKAFSVSHPLFVDYSDPIRWHERIVVVPGAENNWTPAEDEPEVRQYEVFLPWPEADDLRSLLGTPSLADPIIYAHVGITAADNRTHTKDDPRWDDHVWGRRFGNESQLGARVTVFRVLRESPAVPVPPPDSDRGYASAADYYGRSFYTYRWRPVEGLRAHLFRASDDALFKTDWLMRTTRGALDPSNILHDEIFKGAIDLIDGNRKDWSRELREAVAAQLNGVRAPSDYGSLSPDARLLLARLPGNDTVSSFDEIQERDWSIRASRQDASFVENFPSDWDEARWRSAAGALGRISTFDDYANLGNDALRILAALPGNERAFSQITSAALDPQEPDPADPTQPRWRNRLGPDNADDFSIDPTLCAYTDILNGRSIARYFYRSAHVDGAHNRSELSLSGPPVWLKDVMPPRTPVFTSVLAGPQEKQITLSWATSSEPDLAEYRVYRSDTEGATRDLRLMQLVHAVRVPADLPKESADLPSGRSDELSWTDEDIPALQRRWYRMVAVDSSGNISDPSETLAAQAYDDTLPEAPPLSVSWTEGPPPVVRASWTCEHQSRLERRQNRLSPWLPVSDWLPSGTQAFDDPADPMLIWQYRLRVRKATGAIALGDSISLRRVR